jgi:hypothetical protein
VQTQSPQFITVTLPLQASLISDPQAEKCYAQGLTGALRESYPDSILEVCWSDQAEHVQIDFDGDHSDLREEILRTAEWFSRLWLLAMQTVRNYLQDRLSQHAQLLPTGLSSMATQLVIQETRLDGHERVLMSRRQVRGTQS